MTRHIRLLGLLAGIFSAASLVSAGQLSGTLAGPGLGSMWSTSDGKLHPLLGIAGNATIGNAEDLGFTFSQVLALDGRHFLASTDANAAVLSINVAAVPASITVVANAPAAPSLAVGSRGGTSAGLYYAAQQRVLIVTGLPSTPNVSYIVDVSSAGQPLSRMAVDDSGSMLLYSVSDGARDTLYGWTPANGYRLLTTSDSISDIALAVNGDAIVADAKMNEIFSIVNPKGTAARFLLADDRAGVSNPTSVTVSAAGQIYVASATSDTILVLNSDGNLLRTQYCGCEPAGFFLMKDSLYRLSDRTDRTLYLLEAGTTSDRIVFVPPGRNIQ